MEKLFNVGVKAVVRKGDQVLIMKTRKGFWEVPGGRIDGNESIEQALDRELHEELPNIRKFKVGRVLDARRLHKDIHGDVSLVLVFFEVTAEFDGDPLLSDEHETCKWVSSAEALKSVQEIYRPAIQQLAA